MRGEKGRGMTTKAKSVFSCPTCGSKRTETDGYHYTDDGRKRRQKFRCRKCGQSFMWTYPEATPTEGKDDDWAVIDCHLKRIAEAIPGYESWERETQMAVIELARDAVLYGIGLTQPPPQRIIQVHIDGPVKQGEMIFRYDDGTYHTKPHPPAAP